MKYNIAYTFFLASHLTNFHTQSFYFTMKIPIIGKPYSSEPMKCAKCSVQYETGDVEGIICTHNSCGTLNSNSNNAPVFEFICYSCLKKAAVDDHNQCCYICNITACRMNARQLLRQKLPNEEVKAFEIRSLQFEASRNPSSSQIKNVSELRPCLNAGCRSVVDLGKRKGKTVICESCNTRHCARSKCEFHLKRDSCEEHLLKNKKELINEKTQKLLEEHPNGKICPSCQDNVVPNGDNEFTQVTCRKCSFDFCWICLKAKNKHDRRDLPRCKCDNDSLLTRGLAILSAPFLFPLAVLNPSFIHAEDVLERGITARVFPDNPHPNLYSNSNSSNSNSTNSNSSNSNSSNSHPNLHVKHHDPHAIHEDDVEDPDAHK